MKPTFTAFRGEHGHKVLQSHMASISFSDREGTARLYALQPNDRKKYPTALQPKVIIAALTINNPIINTPTDPFLDFQVLSAVFDREALIRLAHRFADYIHDTNLWDETFSDRYTDITQLLVQEPERVLDLYMLAFPLLDDEEVVSKLRDAGFDGAIHAGYGENSCEVEFKVFYPEQVVITRVKDLQEAEIC